MMETYLSIHIQKSIYDYHTIFMVSWWRRYAYFNNEQILISTVVFMNATYGYQDCLDQYLVQNAL